MRHSDALIVHGDFELLLPDHHRIFAYSRTHPELGSLLVVANCSDDPTQVPEGLIRDWGRIDAALGNYPGDVRLAAVLNPWEVVVLRSSKAEDNSRVRA
jgi:oligo-1,6-glucosidase